MRFECAVAIAQQYGHRTRGAASRRDCTNLIHHCEIRFAVTIQISHLNGYGKCARREILLGLKCPVTVAEEHRYRVAAGTGIYKDQVELSVSIQIRGFHRCGEQVCHAQSRRYWRESKSAISQAQKQ